LADAMFLLEEWQRDRSKLKLASERCYRYSRQKFTWQATAMELGSHLERVVATADWGPWRRSPLLKVWRMVVGRYRIDGITGISKAVAARVKKVPSRLLAKLKRS
jgi:hypothetical protein